jgi:hypothetical protein
MAELLRRELSVDTVTSVEVDVRRWFLQQKMPSLGITNSALPGIAIEIEIPCRCWSAWYFWYWCHVALRLTG